jgi:8-oxo-dGTP diphosphatase
MSKHKKIVCRDIQGNTKEVSSDQLTFRPSVYGVLIENNKVLLSKQWGGYDFPGGGIEIRETIEEALKREFFEETGLKIEPIKPIACETSFFYPTHSKKLMGQYWNAPLIYFLVTQVGGKISNNYVDEDELGYMDLPEWIELDRIGEIKFYNSVDNAMIIQKACPQFSL